MEKLKKTPDWVFLAYLTYYIIFLQKFRQHLQLTLSEWVGINIFNTNFNIAVSNLFFTHFNKILHCFLILIKISVSEQKNFVGQSDINAFQLFVYQQHKA